MDALTVAPKLFPLFACQASPPGLAAQHSDPWRVRSTRFLLLLAMSVGSVLGCSGDTTGPTPLSASQAYWALRLNYHAVNLATTSPSNIVQLAAAALNAAGDTLAGAGAARYSVNDSSVTVSPTGLVTAHFATPGQPTQIIASLRLQGVTLFDTAFVQVTDTAPQQPLSAFSLQPAAGDSAKCAFPTFGGVCATLPVYATDVPGDTLLNASTHLLLVYFTSSDPTVATIDRSTGDITAVDTGRVTFYATTLAYGVVKRDSLHYVIGNVLFAGVAVSPEFPLGSRLPVFVFGPPTLTVGVGASVLMIVSGDVVLADTIDVVFDDSTAVTGAAQLNGTVNPISGGQFQISNQITGGQVANQGAAFLQFPKGAGTYTYHSRKYGTGGTILVGD